MTFRFTEMHLAIAVFLGFLLGAGAAVYFESTTTNTGVQVHSIFSPAGEQQIIGTLHSAHESIDVEMYLFSYQKLANELIAANERGVHVRVLLQPTLSGNNPNLEKAEYLRAAGIEVRWAIPTRTNHAKFLIIDGKRVLVGSHNWSFSAMNTNREASVVVDDEETAREFESEFEADWNAAYS